ncbi:PaaX family transcriptional regulator C-terminal domain-containing protein [Microbacterium sp. BG28]|uniref:PaaX family transcriptional regulator n=1 Tax=Microbacterium sp. BG28 TaxID=3097356 RepID=UPI002A599691|nr:PaaX family transcriptional regulator C-terminal domain-containing protein [Microbacterium sp. BG28]MDY0829746.1 PaaX family transcriptional regulator C-terminal domain-containing protein [Microbacterium sp. BG28]
MSDTRQAPTVSIGRKRSPAHQILTLFGDYWWGVDAPLPTGALLAAMSDLGVKAPATRASLTRLTDRDLLVLSKSGRRTSHALTDRGASVLADEAQWLRRFGRDDPVWDGLWSAVLFSIPEKERPLRHAARTRLRWLGYAPLYDGVWISPFDSVDAAVGALTSLGVGQVSTLRGALATAPGDSPTRAWDLSEAEREYAEFLARVGDGGQELTSAAALERRTSLMLAWQSFRHTEPGHPMRLMPAGWPRERARGAFVAVYDALGPAAEKRMREHVAAIEPELAPLVQPQRLS